jgi:hypothetical protein
MMIGGAKPDGEPSRRVDGRFDEHHADPELYGVSPRLIRRSLVARQSGWESSDNQDGHFGGRGGEMIVAARR